MTKFYTGIRSVEVYIKEIERYYNLLKRSKDIDQYGHYLILMKNQIEFLSIYIIEEDKFEEFETNIRSTDIDKDMVTTIITTVRANIKFIIKALKLTRQEKIIYDPSFIDENSNETYKQTKGEKLNDN